MFPSISKLAQSAAGLSGGLPGIDPVMLSEMISKVTEVLGDPEGNRENLPAVKQAISNMRLAMANSGGDAYKVFALNELELKVETLCQTLSEPKGQFSGTGAKAAPGGEDEVEKMQKAANRMAELQQTLSETIRSMHEMRKSAISNLK
jgi:hypothetical protein